MENKVQGLSGPLSWFRRKVRQRLSVTFTALGLGLLDETQRRLGNVSRADLFEALLWKYGPALTVEDIQQIAADVNARTDAAAA